MASEAFQPIQALVAKAIRRFPDHIAVECADGKLTYAELDRRADDIAVALQEAGAAPGALVPVLAEDRRELVAAVLGVLRIGGVVVPLDATAQQRRLEQALNDTDASWVVTGSDLGGLPAKVLAAAGATETTRIDIADTAGTSARRAVVTHEPSPDDPCYVFFTSGSTGRPKGIVGRLGSVDHFIRWETGLLGVDPGWRVSQLISPAFDAVLRDIFVPLTTGATLCVPPPDTLLDPAELSRWLEASDISLVHTVPSLFRRLATAPGEHGFTALECVALSGEKLAPRDAAGWFDRFGERTKLLNLYGPSETTMTKTFHFVTRADTERESIPIGRPMPETEVLVLTDRGQLAAAGEVGEIYLCTPHRSLGYHRQPDATAKAFVPDPRGGSAELAYRTGDFGRLSADGVLEYLGRKDHQVKIGGVRVELGGVESVLRKHPAVAEAAVVAGNPPTARRSSARISSKPLTSIRRCCVLSCASACRKRRCPRCSCRRPNSPARSAGRSTAARCPRPHPPRPRRPTCSPRGRPPSRPSPGSGRACCPGWRARWTSGRTSSTRVAVPCWSSSCCPGCPPSSGSPSRCTNSCPRRPCPPSPG